MLTLTTMHLEITLDHFFYYYFFNFHLILVRLVSVDVCFWFQEG